MSAERRPNKELGDFGERIAGHRLEAAGMRIRGRKVRTVGGEIDILAEDGDDFVFVEVRTRRGERGLAAESLTPTKLRRMWQCAVDYCDSNSIDPSRIRIDAVTVEIDRRGSVAGVTHFRGLEIPD